MYFSNLAFVISSLASLAFGAALPEPLASPASGALFPVETVHTFPVGTWVENLAIRHNGHILASIITSPSIHQFDPSNPHDEAKLISLPSQTVSGILGIAELASDTFYVATVFGNVAKLQTDPGSGKIYGLRFRSNDDCEPEVTHVADLPQSNLLNGVTGLDPPNDIVLVADSALGQIWRVNVETGAVDVAIKNSYTAGPTPQSGLTTNGVHTRGDYLYFDTSENGTFVRVPIDRRGSPTGPFELLEKNGFTPDDFALAPGPSSSEDVPAIVAADISTEPNSVIAFPGSHGHAYGPPPTSGGKFVTLAHVEGPTAVQFGRTHWDRESVYVSTSGGDEQYRSGHITDPGAVVRIDLARKW